MSSNRDPYQFLQRMIDTYQSTHNERYWKEIDDIIAQKKGGSILDIGCGPGLLLKNLEGKVEPKKMYGIDLSDVMLDHAKNTTFKGYQKDKIEFIQKHMQEDPELPKNLDLIFASRVLRSFENQVEVLTEINKSLNQGGFLILLDWDQASLSTYEEYFKKYDDQLELQDKVRLHRIFSRYSIDDWVYLLANTGFHIKKAFQINSVRICVVGEKA